MVSLVYRPDSPLLMIGNHTRFGKKRARNPGRLAGGRGPPRARAYDIRIYCNANRILLMTGVIKDYPPFHNVASLAVGCRRRRTRPP